MSGAQPKSDYSYLVQTPAMMKLVRAVAMTISIRVTVTILFNAGEGSDLIVGGSGLGDDTYEGGAGSDTVSYTSALSADYRRSYTKHRHSALILVKTSLAASKILLLGQGNDTLILNEAEQQRIWRH